MLKRKFMAGSTNGR